MVVELTHVASLYHDDVMDEARLRRGSASANARWGNTVAILVGDFLFARASEEVAELGPDYVRLQSRTFARLVQGQIAETVGPQDADPLEHYLSVVADKTASLIATSALFGAKVAGAELSVQRALAAYAEEIGTVFQLSDDIIDVTSDETGKTRARTCARASRPCRRCCSGARPTRPHRRMLGCCSCWTPTSARTTTWPRRWCCCAPTRASTRREPRSSVEPTGPGPS